MTEITEAPPLVNKTVQAVLGIAVLAFNGAWISWLILFGKTENSIHISALSWLFTASLFIMAGFGLGSSQVTKILETMKR